MHLFHRTIPYFLLRNQLNCDSSIVVANWNHKFESQNVIISIYHNLNAKFVYHIICNFVSSHIGFMKVAMVIGQFEYQKWVCCPPKPLKSGFTCNFYFPGPQNNTFLRICKLGKLPNHANYVHCQQLPRHPS